MTDVVAVTLAQHEAAIERGLTTFVEVGEALLAIRDERLYRQTHATFEDYCRERWGMSDRRARQLMSAAEVTGTVVPAGLPAPSNEAQARELARVPEPDRADVWQRAVEQTGGKPTAAAVREAHQPKPAETLDRLFSAASAIIEHGATDEAEPVAPIAFPAPEPEPEPTPSVEDFLADQAPVQDAMYRAAFIKAIGRLNDVMRFDTDRLADLLGEDEAWLLDRCVTDLTTFNTRLTKQRTGLRVITGGGK